jgi:hypothetical protein
MFLFWCVFLATPNLWQDMAPAAFYDVSITGLGLCYWYHLLCGKRWHRLPFTALKTPFCAPQFHQSVSPCSPKRTRHPPTKEQSETPIPRLYTCTLTHNVNKCQQSQKMHNLPCFLPLTYLAPRPPAYPQMQQTTCDWCAIFSDYILVRPVVDQH